MTVEICIPWRSSGEIERDKNWDWVQQRYAMLHPEWRIVTGDSDPAKPFNIGEALNNAIDKATADIVILAGADSVMSSSSLRHAAIYAESYPWVMASDAYVRIDRDQTASVWEMSPSTPNVPTTHGGSRMSLCQLGWGVLVFKRSAFDQVWYDERLTAAWEDSQIGAAAACLLGDPYKMSRTLTVLLWHPNAHRQHHPDFPDGSVLYGEYRQAYFGKNQQVMRELLAQARPSRVSQ